MPLLTVTLKPGRDKPARHRHPWIFSGGIARVEGSPEPGSIVRVVSDQGEFLAHGYFNAKSQITVRLLSWNEIEVIDDAWWERQVRASIHRRKGLAQSSDTNAYRLVYAEADGLPGLIVDRYDDSLVTQLLTAGIERVRETVLRVLSDSLRPSAIIDQSDPDIRRLEGLEAPPHAAFDEGEVVIRENGYHYIISLSSGQKTGFYLDQRENRRRVAAYANGRAVLDCFCYSGGFTIPILANHPRAVTCIDSSQPALALLKRNVELLNEEHPATAGISVESITANVFEHLRKFRDQARQFDMIILDPPKLAASHNQVAKALRAYKDLNLLAMKLLTPDGILATFSCSGAVSRAAFQESLAWAATDAGRTVQIIEQLSQGSDHPIRVSFPESENLKGFICRVE